jgi:hypothetical protein
MAPIKPEEQARRQDAADAIAQYLDDGRWPPTADQLSEIKGLFNRTHRQDQWDWFTVWQQLGRPGQPFARSAADALTGLRKALADGTNQDVADARDRLVALGVGARLRNFPRDTTLSDGVGYVYVLSTREQPRLLKIGYTDRRVEDRVAEINRATGVVYPFGVRALWVVASAREVEQELHELLVEHRVRRDREFFDLDFNDAFPIIRNYVNLRRQER